MIVMTLVSRMVRVDGSMTDEKHSLIAYKRPICIRGLVEVSKVTSLCDLRGCRGVSL